MASAPPKIPGAPPPPVAAKKPPVNNAGAVDINSMLSNRAALNSTINLRAAAAPNLQFENDKLKWLTWESIFNDEKFTHTDDVRAMGVFNMPLNNLRIIVSNKALEMDALLQRFISQFFTDDSLPIETLKKLLYQPWNSNSQNYDAEWTSKVHQTLGEIEADAKAKKKEPVRARFPYNVNNNSDAAKCLGSMYPGSQAGVDPLNPDIKLEDQSWKMWQTASRSCFLETSYPGHPGHQGLRPAIANGRWNFLALADRSTNAVPQGATRPSPGAAELGLDGAPGPIWSVKSGVIFVGNEDQGQYKIGNSACKATLEPDGIVANVRTEYLTALDKYYLQPDGGTRGHVLFEKMNIHILPEILTITCLKSTANEGDQEVVVENDGFQLRDLQRLKSEMRYFPALSTPYVKGNGNLTTWKPQQDLSPSEFDAWNTYWADSYAARIGRAKALLHILYGFAPITPNMQNFVFEYDPAKKAFARTILRDVLDFRIHTSWARLILSSDADFEKALDKSLVDPASPFKVDSKLPKTIQNIFQYEATTQSPVAPLGVVMLKTSEAGVYAPLDPANDLEYTSRTSYDNVTTTKWRIKVAKPGELVPDLILPADSIQYFSGLQLNWFAYTALYRGDRLSKGDEDPKEWKRSYLAMLDWGLKHAMGFVDAVNGVLQEYPPPLQAPTSLKYEGKLITSDVLLNLQVKDIQVETGKPDPGANTSFSLQSLKNGIIDGTTARKDLDRVHKKICGWDFQVSGIIEEAIYKDPQIRKTLRYLLRGKTT